MTDSSLFYKEQIKKHSTSLTKIKKQLAILSIIRMLVFLVAALAVYFFNENTQLLIVLLVVSLVVFLFLVSKHSDKKYIKNKYENLIKINETELAVAAGNYDDLPDGSNFKNPEHAFSQDIDLFGKRSFFQYVNRASLVDGISYLASLFTANHTDNIIDKQEAIKELAKNAEWRQNYAAIANLIKTEEKTDTIITWLKNYKAFVPAVMKWLPYLYSTFSVFVAVLCFFEVIPNSTLFYVFIGGLLITGTFLKKINLLSVHTSKVRAVFLQYHKLINAIEGKEFNASVLKKEKAILENEGGTVSGIIKQFGKLLSALDNRHNIIVALLGNGFFLMDLMQSYKIEQWIAANGNKTEQWFKTLAVFDAYNSLGNYVFNHHDHSFPEIVKDGATLIAKDAAHPLLPKEKAVYNDIVIDENQFLVITGANMAGKSTFLRTVSLSVIMANMGLPISAKEVKYNPVKLITSMRTVDSLANEESYFFSELKRLKFIVDQLENNNYFIVLDEILKGTNSTDKAQGSRKFVERLVAAKATGIIATHDLSLCAIASDFEQVENKYFDAQIIKDELFFDYKIKSGVCQNMNASFLLEKMGIV